MMIATRAPLMIVHCQDSNGTNDHPLGLRVHGLLHRASKQNVPHIVHHLVALHTNVTRMQVVLLAIVHVPHHVRRIVDRDPSMRGTAAAANSQITTRHRKRAQNIVQQIGGHAILRPVELDVEMTLVIRVGLEEIDDAADSATQMEQPAC